MSPVESPIFLIGTGRSGTTLIQRLLNSYSDVIIWGEHAGFLRDISRAYHDLAKSPSMEEFSYAENRQLASTPTSEYFKDPKRWQAWNNWFTERDVRELFRNYIRNTFNPSHIGAHKHWGFKEIRYGLNDDVPAFLLELFPESKFIFIVRNGLNTIESQLNAFHRGKSNFLVLKRLMQLPIAVRIARNWSRQNLYLKAFAEKHPENCVFVRYEDIVGDREQMTQLFDFVGKPITETQDAILEMKSGRGSGFGKEQDANQRYRRLGPIPIAVLSAILARANRILGY